MALKDITSLSQLATSCPTEKDVIHLLMNDGLLKKTATCDKCNNQMALRSRGETYEWRCRISKSKDCSSKSVKHDSFFAKTKLSLMKATKVLIMWIQNYSSKQIVQECALSARTVCDWKNFLREICTDIEKNYPKIGGQGHVVEVDESNIHSRKYGVGRATHDEWVLGGIDRETGRVFARLVPNRSAAVLVPLLQSNIEKDSCVYSDEWRSYSQLKKYFSHHFTVQHKIQFVNFVGTRKVCTNGVEAMWGRMKKPFKLSNGTSSALLPSYLSEFVCRENEKEDFFETILQFMRIPS